MKELPVLANFHYDRIGSWRTGNPFTICFCHTDPMYNGTSSFIVKGGSKNVDEFIENRPYPLIVFRTYWWHGMSRGGNWGPTFTNFKKFTMTGETPYWTGIGQWRIRGGPYFYKHFELKYMQKTWARVRRIPRRWLPDYTKMIQATYPLDPHFTI